MGINKQRWSPDSCGCVIIQTVTTDDNTGEVLDIGIDKLEKVCTSHASIKAGPAPTEKYEKILEENQRKNFVHGELLESGDASYVKEDIDSDGNTVKSLKPEIKYHYWYEGDYSNGERILKISLENTRQQKAGFSSSKIIDNNQKSFYANKFNSRFGAGKVEIVDADSIPEKVKKREG